MALDPTFLKVYRRCNCFNSFVRVLSEFPFNHEVLVLLFTLLLSKGTSVEKSVPKFTGFFIAFRLSYFAMEIYLFPSQGLH